MAIITDLLAEAARGKPGPAASRVSLQAEARRGTCPFRSCGEP